jgi:DNA polymerase III delta prime subunit
MLSPEQLHITNKAKKHKEGIPAATEAVASRPEESEEVKISPEEEKKAFDMAKRVKEIKDKEEITEEEETEALSLLKKIEKIYSTEKDITVEEAIEILGAKEVLGPKELQDIWGIELATEDIPEIPFSQEELERAKELGQYLILRADKTPDGKPLTILAMDVLKKQDFEEAGGGKILYDIDWYKNEDFFTKENPALSWALTSKEVIPDSTNKNYLEQTEEIISYIKNEVFKDIEIPEEYRKAITEFEKEKEEIQNLMSSDWQKAAEKLENLKITQLTRQTPAEVLFDGISYFLKNKEKLLENIYTWTSRRRSDGRLVRVGDAGSDGAYVRGSAPDYSNSSLGVSFSRRV